MEYWEICQSPRLPLPGHPSRFGHCAGSGLWGTMSGLQVLRVTQEAH